MRDLVFVAYLAALFAFGFKRPFLFVLAYVYVDIVSPQRLTYLLLNSIPISLIAVVFAVGGWAIADKKDGLRITPRQLMILALIAYCYATTLGADFPVEAKDKWDWVWKGLAFSFFLPLTLRTKLRIEGLLLFIVLSVSSIVIVGGIKTLASGGGYGELNLMVSNNSGLYEGSIISAVAVSIMPLIWWFARFGTVFPPDWRVKLFCAGLAFACMLIPVGTSARTGLVCIALLAVLMVREVKKKGRYIGLLLAGALCAVPFLPSAFSERMSTIKTYQADASASTRIEVWKWTLNFVKDHPFGGGFEAYRQNSVRYYTVQQVTEGTHTKIVQTLQVDHARAYHSSYFEMLGEQGYLGLALWLAIQLTGLIRMQVLRMRYGKDEDAPWIAPLATALQHTHVIYLIGAAFVGIAFQPFLWMIVGTQIALDAWCARRRAAQSFRPIGRRERPVLAAA
jgi:probable O-glycosylation ligase (exosortase A-associated)